jgi:hypothetical protein
MKTNIYISVLSLAAIFSFLFVSCDESDTTKPVINLIEPEDGDALQIGNPNGIHLEMELSDNEQLASYKIEIHNNFDNHEHRSATGDEIVPFAFDSIWTDISGKRNADIHHHDIKIPANATPGDYHFMVYCTDAAGNESHVAANIVLGYDPEEPHEGE